MKISVITKRVGEPPRHVWMSNTLENFQRFVGGYIEAVSPCSDMTIICDEEGLLKEKPYNCTLFGVPFHGDILFVGVNGEEFADIPVDYKRFKELFRSLWEV